MVPSEPTSAVIVRIPIPTPIARIRRTWDRGGGLDVPPHVTILFPFVPPDRLDASVRRELAAVATTQRPFDVRFTSVGRFPGLLYLAPDPSEPFVELTEACAARFPAFPPYGGVHEEVVPHLTVVEGDEAPIEDVSRQLEASLPFSHHVRAIEVITPSTAGVWRLRWRLPLGPRP